MDKEYVEREGLFAYLEKRLEHHPHIISFLFPRIADVPAADVVEVRHGHWYDIVQCEDVAFATCSVCGIRGKVRTNRSEWGIWHIDSPYCPNCGAKMDGGK